MIVLHIIFLSKLVNMTLTNIQYIKILKIVTVLAFVAGFRVNTRHFTGHNEKHLVQICGSHYTAM